MSPAGAWFEYVVLGANGCPSGFSLNAGNCYKPSATISGVPLVALADLSTMHIELQSNASSDIFTMTIEGKAYTASFPTVLGLGDGGWNSAEFGLYGDLGGSQVAVSAGTTLVAQLVTEPATNTVSCSSSQNVNTVESSTLTLVPGCCLDIDQGSTPGIQFEASNVSGESCSLCGAAGPDVLQRRHRVLERGRRLPGGSVRGTGYLEREPDLHLRWQPQTARARAANYATTSPTASGAWAGGTAPSFTFSGMPEGVSCAASNDVAPSSGPSTIKCTSSPSTPLGTHAFEITATIGDYPAESTPIDLTVTACEPLTCGDIDYVCGSLDNGCGTTQDCGTCPSGESCTAGACYKCAERTCPVPEFFNLTTCKCEACACGTLHVDGHYICDVCGP